MSHISGGTTTTNGNKESVSIEQYNHSASYSKLNKKSTFLKPQILVGGPGFSRQKCCVVVLVVLLCVTAITIGIVFGLCRINEKLAYYKSLMAAEQAGELDFMGGGEDERGYSSNHPRQSGANLSYENGAVSSDVGDCSEIGNTILGNGTAVDAAIATLFCLGVHLPFATGLGGGFVMTIYKRDSEVTTVVNAQPTAPSKADDSLFQENQTDVIRRILSVGVPGELRGYKEAYSMHGGLSWDDLIKPSIRLCKDGFRVTAALAKALKYQREAIRNEPTLQEFINPDTGDIYKQGEVMKRPILGRTLEIIATRGADDFYTGDLSKKLIHDLQEAGGILNSHDLFTYQATIREPLEVSLRDGVTLYTPPPPAGGALVAFILKVLDISGFERKHLQDKVGEALFYHKIAETFKFAFGVQTKMSDETFTDVMDYVKDITSDAYARNVSNVMSNSKTYQNFTYYGAGAEFHLTDVASTHVSVMARNGDCISVTSSLNNWFGAQFMSPSTGVIFNNAVDMFSWPRYGQKTGLSISEANLAAPNKRPASLLAPSIFVDNNREPVLVLGGATGYRIPTSVSYVALRHLWLNETLQEAIEAKREHHNLIPNTLYVEAEFPEESRKRLISLGHRVWDTRIGGSVNGIWRTHDDKKIRATSDFRRGGWPSGH